MGAKMALVPIVVAPSNFQLEVSVPVETVARGRTSASAGTVLQRPENRFVLPRRHANGRFFEARACVRCFRSLPRWRPGVAACRCRPAALAPRPPPHAQEPPPHPTLPHTPCTCACAASAPPPAAAGRRAHQPDLTAPAVLAHARHQHHRNQSTSISTRTGIWDRWRSGRDWQPTRDSCRRVRRRARSRDATPLGS